MLLYFVWFFYYDCYKIYRDCDFLDCRDFLKAFFFLTNFFNCHLPQWPCPEQGLGSSDLQPSYRKLLYSFPFTPADEFLASPNIYSVLTLQIIKSDPVPTSNLTVSPAQTMFYTLVFSARCIMLRSGNISCPCLPHSFLVGVICCRPTLPCDFLPLLLAFSIMSSFRSVKAWKLAYCYSSTERRKCKC